MTVTPNNNATALATALLGSGVTLSGTPTFTGAAGQAGTFTNAPALVGFSSGILLSSGNVSDAAYTWAGQNLPSTDEGQPGNSLLSGLISGQATYDASVLTFSFIPTSSTIYFAYTFASAEYPNYIGQFNDVFGFFVNGTNYALIPGTNNPVSINDVNAATNSAYFNKYNGTGDALPYGGETKVLTVTVPVNAGQVNTITLGVADALDHALDSAVFIQSGSFSTAPPPTTSCATATATWGQSTSSSLTITLTPSTATNTVGTSDTVTATVTGSSVSGVPLTFTIVSGPNAGAKGSCNPTSCTTGASGVVTFTYTGSATAGTDSIQACTQVGTTKTCSNTVTSIWTSAGAACNYFVQPLTYPNVPSAGAQNGFFQIFTGQTCKWGANTNDPRNPAGMLTILGGLSGTGSPGAVSYSVSANSSSKPRMGYITITDGTNAVQTHTIAQLPGGPPCTVGVGPLYGTADPSGTAPPKAFLLSTASTCAWSTLPSDTWIQVTPSSGTGSQTLTFTGQPNTTGTSRSGSIAVGGQTFTVTQAVPPPTVPANTPSISSGGVVNAASSRGGPIARGSFFTIYGTNIGPGVPVQATSYPIPQTAGGVVVNITQGSVTKQAYLHFVSNSQINAIVPSDAPLGNVQITAVYNGTTSATEPATLVDASFGIFSAASGVGPGIIQNWNSATNVLLNMPSIPAKQNQLAILWGTGLGPITSGDGNPPPTGNLPASVQVEVAGITVPASSVIYQGRAPNFAGVDNIYFYLPSNVPEGCSVPVRVNVGGTWSNTVRMAVSYSGNACQDPVNPYSSVTTNGAKMGNIVLMRAELNGQFQAGQPSTDSVLDVGAAVFTVTAAGGQLAFSGAANLPPVGSCSSNTRSLDLTSLLGGNLLSMSSTVSSQLDAGAKITVTGPGSKGSVDLQPLGTNAGSYMGLLGGTVPLSGSQTMPLFLDPGSSITITGAGGKDVGAISAKVTIPNAVTWTNRDQIDPVDRTKPLTINWTGGDSSQMLLIAGGVEDGQTNSSGGFYCLASSTAGTFTIPVSILSDVPATRPLTGSSTDTFGAIALFSVPQGNPPAFQASGLDLGFVIPSNATLKALQFK
jgi:uncharacterized protein (TIGR03437 family)